MASSAFTRAGAHLRFAPDTIDSLDEANTLRTIEIASVATIRWLFGIIPECRSVPPEEAFSSAGIPNPPGPIVSAHLAANPLLQNRRVALDPAPDRDVVNREIPLRLPDGLTWHTFRHTFATRLVRVTVRDLLGHANIKTTMRCAHSNDEAKRRAVQRLDEKRDKNATVLPKKEKIAV